MSKSLFYLFAFIFVAGCATIMGNPYQVMPILSTPSDAVVTITDERGIEVFKDKTPANATLQKSDNSYFGKKRYTVAIAKEGYQTIKVTVSASPNGWYLAGNLIFGGLIGWLIVDPMSGNMYTLSPSEIRPSLNQESDKGVPSNAKTLEESSKKSGEIRVVLLQEVSPELQRKMIALEGNN